MRIQERRVAAAVLGAAGLLMKAWMPPWLLVLVFAGPGAVIA
jgi:hypothetical protein